jgi:hypothetical protein
MILLRRRADGQRESLHVAKRPSTDQPFGEPREIAELRPRYAELRPRSETEWLKAPCLQPDGLTLYLWRLSTDKHKQNSA